MSILTSVWEDRRDSPLVEALIRLHGPNPLTLGPVVDVTYGGGLFWKDSTSPYRNQLVGCDRDARRALTLQADFRCLPFRDGSVSVLAFDPPHIPDVGRARPKIMSQQYAIEWGSADIGASMVCFLAEAARVLRPQGIVVAKLSDQVQTGTKHWQVVDFVNSSRLVGLTPCDHVVKVRKQPGPQPWGEDRQRHAWQRHSDFIVVRKGKC